VGIDRLETLMRTKRIRWAMNVHVRNEPELQPIAERILRELLGTEVGRRWITGQAEPSTCEIREWEQGDGMGYKQK